MSNIELVERMGLNSVKYEKVDPRMSGDILRMSVAEMDYQVCPQVRDALIKRIETGFLGYGKPYPSLYQVIADWYNTHYQMTLNPNHFITTPSVNVAVALSILATTKPKDKIILHTPVYMPLAKAITENDREWVKSPLKLVDTHYEVEFELLGEQMKDASAILLCSPHNPTGMVFSKEDLVKIVEMSRANHVQIISDEIHADWTYCPFTSVQTLDENAIVILSASKTFNLQSFQTSFTHIEQMDIRQKFQKILDGFQYKALNSLAYLAIETAYIHGDEWLKKHKGYTFNNMLLIKNQLQKSNVKVIENDSLFMMWLDFSNIYTDVVQLEEALIEVNLAVNTSTMFAESRPMIRINVATDTQTVMEAVRRISHMPKVMYEVD